MNIKLHFYILTGHFYINYRLTTTRFSSRTKVRDFVQITRVEEKMSTSVNFSTTTTEKFSAGLRV